MQTHVHCTHTHRHFMFPVVQISELNRLHQPLNEASILVYVDNWLMKEFSGVIVGLKHGSISDDRHFDREHAIK